jgi:uncharacterized protein YecT (DUF1311 family)
MSKKLPTGFGEPEIPKKNNWALLIWGVIIFFAIKGMFFSASHQLPISSNHTSQVTKPSLIATQDPPIASLPATMPAPDIAPDNGDAEANKDRFDKQLQAAYLEADRASDLLKLTEPVRASKDIHELLGERYSKNSNDFLNSPDFKLGEHSPLSLYDASRIFANTYLISEFEAEKEGEWMGNNLTAGRLFYTSDRSQYRLIPKLNFRSGDRNYLVFDRLKNDGQYSDCHACQSPISVIKYYLSDDGKIVIDSLYEGVATLGTWGNAGVIQFAKFSSGDEGFVVTNVTMNQGIASEWLDAFKISPKGITQLTQLSKSKLEPPEGEEEQPAELANAQIDVLSVDIAEIKTKAETGNAEAQFSLGAVFDLGRQDIAIDYNQAAAWYHKSAVQGLAKSQHNLAVLYHDGQGVTKSYEQSYFWLILASKSGNENSIRLRDEVEKQLTKEQIAEVQKKAMNWIEGKSFADLKPLNVASFDCSKAKTTTEIVICSDDVLAELDRSVGELYNLALEKYPQKKSVLRGEQKAFLKERLSGCNVAEETISETQVKGIAECLKPKYERRLSTLRTYIPNASQKKSLFSRFFKPKQKALND